MKHKYKLQQSQTTLYDTVCEEESDKENSRCTIMVQHEKRDVTKCKTKQ